MTGELPLRATHRANPAVQPDAISNQAQAAHPFVGHAPGISTFYEQVGGSETFRRLVDEFYRGVADDPVLRAMYPEGSLAPAAERLRLFLEEYWGGPTTYSQRRGHPRLKLRHRAYHINPAARDRWLGHMRRALDTLELPPLHDETLWDYLDRAGHWLVNTFEE